MYWRCKQSLWLILCFVIRISKFIAVQIGRCQCNIGFVDDNVVGCRMMITNLMTVSSNDSSTLTTTTTTSTNVTQSQQPKQNMTPFPIETIIGIVVVGAFGICWVLFDFQFFGVLSKLDYLVVVVGIIVAVVCVIRRKNNGDWCLSIDFLNS